MFSEPEEIIQKTRPLINDDGSDDLQLNHRRHDQIKLTLIKIVPSIKFQLTSQLLESLYFDDIDNDSKRNHVLTTKKRTAA